MSFKEKKKSGDSIKEELEKLFAEPHQDLEWNEKFKAHVRKHFDI